MFDRSITAIILMNTSKLGSTKLLFKPLSCGGEFDDQLWRGWGYTLDGACLSEQMDKAEPMDGKGARYHIRIK